MEIKTIKNRLNNAADFDRDVNAAMADGWRLTRREVLMFPAQPHTGSTYFNPMLYAELVKLDAPAEFDPLDAVRSIQAMCVNTPLETCNTAKCPLYAWCGQITEGKDPSDWILPDEEGEDL